jgi:putative membrane protein
MGFLLRVIVNAVAIWLAAQIVPGIATRSTTTLVAAALVLGLINALVRPVLLILTLPLTLVTLGLFLFVLNAVCLWLTSAIVPGFEVRGFWSAFGAALIVSALSWVVNGFVSDRGRVVVINKPPPRPVSGRVIRS